MKTTDHFEKRLAERMNLKREWCERAIQRPLALEQQDNGYWRFWIFVEETGKFLRVITMEDRETIVTAHWDRRYKGPR